MSIKKSKTTKHEHGKSYQVKTHQGLREAFIVLYQAAEPSHPGKTRLHYLTPGQEDEASFSL